MVASIYSDNNNNNTNRSKLIILSSKSFVHSLPNIRRHDVDPERVDSDVGLDNPNGTHQVERRRTRRSRVSSSLLVRPICSPLERLE